MRKFIISEKQLKQIADTEPNNGIKVLFHTDKCEFGENRCYIRRKRDGKKMEGVLFDVFIVKNNGKLQLHGIFSNGTIFAKDYETRKVVEKKKLSSDEVPLYYNKENCCYRDLFRLAKKRECKNMTFDEELWENWSSMAHYDLLVERNGVGNWKYKEAIAKVCKSAQHELFNELAWNEDEKEIEIHVPHNITAEFDYVNDLSITILAKKKEYSDFLDGNSEYKYEGYFPLTNNLKLDKNKKLEKAQIIINCKYDANGFIYQNNLYETLFHELNHVYELYCRLLNNEKLDNAEETTQFTKNYNLIGINLSYIFDDIKDKDIKNKMIMLANDIVYDLLNDSEVNAKMAQIYGELCQIYSENKRIKKEEALKKCRTYQYFWMLNSYIPYFFKYLTNNHIRKLIQIIKKTDKDISLFKNKSAFYSKVKKQLRKLRDGIYRTTGLFFADIYDKEPKNITFRRNLNEMKLPEDYKITYALD